MRKRKAKTPKPKPRRKFMPREFSFMDHIHGLLGAAKKLKEEERVWKSFDPNGKPVN